MIRAVLKRPAVNFFKIIPNKMHGISKRNCIFAGASWKDLRLIATTGKNAKAIVLVTNISIYIPQLLNVKPSQIFDEN